MADLVIRGMEMPKSCFLCRFFREVQDYDGTFACCLVTNKEINLKFDGCPLIPLPEGHGRLIDADALLAEDDGYYTQFGYSLDEIREAPTIVPAEVGGEDGN